MPLHNVALPTMTNIG